MPTRDNITAPVDYTTAASLRFEARDRVTITVTGGAIYGKFALEDPPGLYYSNYDFTVEQPMPVAATYNWNTSDFNGKRIVGVQVKRKLSGETPQVTINA